MTINDHHTGQKTPQSDTVKTAWIFRHLAITLPSDRRAALVSWRCHCQLDSFLLHRHRSSLSSPNRESRLCRSWLTACQGLKTRNIGSSDGRQYMGNGNIWRVWFVSSVYVWHHLQLRGRIAKASTWFGSAWFAWCINMSIIVHLSICFFDSRRPNVYHTLSVRGLCPKKSDLLVGAWHRLKIPRSTNAHHFLTSKMWKKHVCKSAKGPFE